MRRPLERYQFPLVLAWCITIHKLQGLSLDKAVVDLRQKCICLWPSICGIQQGAQPWGCHAYRTAEVTVKLDRQCSARGAC